MNKKTNLLVALFTGATFTLFGQACFTSPNDFTAEGPSNGNSITNGDFDNDGDLDIIISNFTAGSPQLTLPRLYYIENNGDGSFQSPVSFSSGQRPIGVSSGDFNNDGNLDVAVLLFQNATLNVMLGNGDGTFMAPQGTAIENLPNDMELADFDGDGDLDVAISCNTGNVDIVLLDSYTATTVAFNPHVTYSAGAIAPSGIAIDDVTGNGELDIVTSNSGSNNVSVLEGSGTGTFGAASNYASGLGAYSVKLANLDGDTDIDIITSNQDGDNISVLINNGAGFDAPVNYTAGDKPMTLDIGDFNGDANIDVVAVNNQDNSVSVFDGNGDGTFQPQNVFPSMGSPRAIIAGDYNGDSNLDFALACLVGQVMPVYLGDGTGTFDFGDFVSTGNAPKSVFNGDFDGDGNLDYAVANSADNTVTTYLGAGDGTFTLDATLVTGNSPSGIVAADFNGDGDVDIAVTNTTDNDVSIFLNTGGGVFGAASDFPAGTGPIAIDSGDVNNDGNIDLFVLNNSNNISVLNGNGSGGFAAATTYATGNTPTSLDVGDVNGDNFDDVVVANGGDNDFRLFTNDGAGNLSTTSDLAVGTNPSDVMFGDLNNDGAPEIITANYGSNNFDIHNNNGSGLFSAFQSNTYNSGHTGPVAISTSDYDSDGNLDVLVVYEGAAGSTGGTSLYVGDGAFGVSFTQIFSTGITPNSIQSGDFNNDSNIDYCVVNEGGNNVSVHLNSTATITALGPTTFCTGGSVDLQAGVAGSYLWSNSATTQTINVTTAGTYNVQTSGQSGWCTSTSPDITVTVNSGPALSFTGTTTICEGDSTNITVSGANNGYTWSHSLGTGATKKLKPTTTTTYNVIGQNSSGCDSDIDITITVNPLPDAGFNALNAAYCESESPVSLTPNISGGTFTGNGVTGTTFDPSSATPGAVEVKYIITDGNGCTDSTSQNVTVNTLPDAGFNTLNAAYCESESPVSLTPNTSGGTFTGDGVSGTTFDPSLATPGSIEVKYVITDGNGCSDSTSQNVTVNTLPDAGFNILDADYCAGVTNVSLVPNTSGGTFTGDGVTGTTFDPSSATPGPVQVKYVITDGNGCSDSTSQSTTVNPLPDAGFNTLNAAYCESESPVSLSPNTSGGVFTGDGVSGTTFDPSLATPGSIEVKYVITDGNGCTDSTSQNVTVNALPDAGFNALDADYCAGVTNVSLVPNTSGGAFTGDGVTGTTFDPSSATPGSVQVKYIITDGNGCTDSTSQTTTVFALPDAVFNTLDPEYCAGVTSVSLNPNEGGGVFTGDGVTGTIFDPSSATPGTIEIKYVITNSDGCTDSTAQTTDVNPLPDASFNTLDPAYCENITTVPLIPATSGGAFSGDGVTGNNFDPSAAMSSPVEVKYIITDGNGCTDSTSQVTVVNPLPDASFTGLAASYCEDAAIVSLTPTSSGGNFSGTGIVGSDFDPSIPSIGNVTITYSITDGNGCSNSQSETTTINSLPDSLFTTLDPTYCSNNAIVTLTPDQSGGAFFGGGVVNGNQFDPNTASLGMNTITYSITDGNNCSSSSSQTVEVLGLPDVTTTYGQATVEANASGAMITYQWVNCDDNFLPIIGETSQSFSPSQNGNYAVIIDDGSCFDTSQCVAVIDVSVSDFTDRVIEVYPNPTNGNFNINLPFSANVTVYNAVGKLIFDSRLNEGITNIDDLENVESGVYFVQVKNKYDQVAVKKIIVQH